jgi:hypothetical protein
VEFLLTPFSVGSKHRIGDETCPFGGLGGFGNRRSLEGSEAEEGWRTRTRLGGPGSVGASLISGGYPLRLRGVPGIRVSFRPRTDTFAVGARIDTSAHRAAVRAHFSEWRHRSARVGARHDSKTRIEKRRQERARARRPVADGSIRMICSETIGIGCWGQGDVAARRDKDRMGEKK